MSVSSCRACTLAYEGKIEELERLLGETPNEDQATDQNERMPLHWACSTGQLTVVNFLLQRGVPVNAADDVQ
jgi:26S proteasome non-ATPase regulatory subunit 10